MGVEEGTRNGEGAEIVEEIKCFKSEPVNNEFGSLFVNDSGDGSSGASEILRTYKRRRQLRSTSNIEVQDGGRASTDQLKSFLIVDLDYGLKNINLFSIRWKALPGDYPMSMSRRTVGLFDLFNMLRDSNFCEQVTLPFTDHCASLNDSNYRLQR
ncbi:hypothetical protein Godav_009337, partial [Gossypium davidsonii]|nr:hypothetical protein [Gossypium davidsonii]